MLSLIIEHSRETGCNVQGRYTDQDKWLTIDELTDCMKMGRTKLYWMAQDSGISASKIGNQWRFGREAVGDWMKNQRSTATKRRGEGVSR